MKERVYESPDCLILQFEKNDVVRTSGKNGDVYVEDGFDENWGSPN